MYVIVIFLGLQGLETRHFTTAVGQLATAGCVPAMAAQCGAVHSGHTNQLVGSIREECAGGGHNMELLPSKKGQKLTCTRLGG